MGAITKKKAVIPIEGALDRDFTRVGRSRIAGRGVYAKRKIPEGSRIIEYKGDRIPLGVLLSEIAAGTATSIYVFRLGLDIVIDGARNGNDARFINHSCDPNCEVLIFGDRVYIYAMRDLDRKEELTFDYQLGPAIQKKPKTADLLAYTCLCGAANCRGSMIARVSRRSKKKSNAARTKRTTITSV